jgi:hypothetical protein
LHLVLHGKVKLKDLSLEALVYLLGTVLVDDHPKIILVVKLRDINLSQF